MTDFLDDRRRALEESFFAKRNQALLERLREEMAATKRQESLAAASGISDEKVLTRLLALQIDADALAALTLAPLVLVAWSDGSIAEDERQAVLHSANQSGIAPDTPAHELLINWLEEPVSHELLETWTGYVRALCSKLDAGARASLKADVVGRARAVAEAAGGLLGFHQVSASEQAVLEKLEAAFE